MREVDLEPHGTDHLNENKSAEYGCRKGRIMAKSRISTYWRDQGVIALIIVAASLALGFGLDWFKARFGLSMMFLATALVGSFLLLISYCAYKVLVQNVVARTDETTGSMVSIVTKAMDDGIGGIQTNVVEELRRVHLAIEAMKSMVGQEWLISRAELLDIEKNTDVEEIWIISQSLAEETNKEFLDMVKSNLKRGICYRYIVADQPAIHARAEQIKSAHGNSKEMQFIFVSDEMFALVAAHDIAIYGPRGRGAEQRMGFMNLPTGDGGNEYFIRLGPRFVQEIVGRLLSKIEPVVHGRMAPAI